MPACRAALAGSSSPRGLRPAMLLIVRVRHCSCSLSDFGFTSVSACRSRSAGSASPGARPRLRGHGCSTSSKLFRAPLDGDQRADRRRAASRPGRRPGSKEVSTGSISRARRRGSLPVRYRSMPTAARSPAATASTTDDGPVTASPPAKIHFSEVWPVTGLTLDEVRRSGLQAGRAVAEPLAGRASGRWPRGPGRPG